MTPLIVKENISLVTQSLPNIHSISKVDLLNTNDCGNHWFKQFQHLQQVAYLLLKVSVDCILRPQNPSV